MSLLTATSGPPDASSSPAAGLLAGVRRIEERIRAVVRQRREVDPAPDDPFRGLYVTDAAIDRLLGQTSGPTTDLADLAGREPGIPTDPTVGAVTGAGSQDRLTALAARAGLTALDVDLLLIAAAPDLDPRFERLFGYLNDDVTRRRAGVAVALELAGSSGWSAAGRARLAPGTPLVDLGLITVEDPDRPLLSRALRVPDRVVAHLLGDDRPDPVLLDVLADPAGVAGRPDAGDADPDADDADDADRADPAAGDGDLAVLGRRLRSQLLRRAGVVYLRDVAGGIAPAAAAAAARSAGRPMIAVDLDRLLGERDTTGLVDVLRREALLAGATLLVGPIETVGADPALRTVLRRVTAGAASLVLHGSASWNPDWAQVVPLLVDVGPVTPTQRRRWWTQALAAQGRQAAQVPTHLVLGPAQVDRAVRAAAALARWDDTATDRAPAGETAGARAGEENGPTTTLTADQLRRGARTQNAAGLERLARRIEPGVGWGDLVLPPETLAQLQDLTDRARLRDRVLTEWRMRPGGGRGRGVTALFVGESGTGKTMSAEVVAAALGLDLYTVNLATVVDKYIGETEKNLERIFTEASGVNAVLLFDEADAIFGKRSDVHDAHDRYANIESAYLLQRMETFDGLAVLSSNLRANIDDAFTRRLDLIVEFPPPDEAARLAIWRSCLAPPVPLGDDVDLDFCARAFALSGGNIRSAATSAGYLAAAEDGRIGMAELVSAVAQEYRKLGRLVLEREFGPHLAAGRPRSTRWPREA